MKKSIFFILFVFIFSCNDNVEKEYSHPVAKVVAPLFPFCEILEVRDFTVQEQDDKIINFMGLKISECGKGLEGFTYIPICQYIIMYKIEDIVFYKFFNCKTLVLKDEKELSNFESEKMFRQLLSNVDTGVTVISEDGVRSLDGEMLYGIYKKEFDYFFEYNQGKKIYRERILPSE